MFGGVSDFSCKYTHGTSTIGGRVKATVRTTVRTDTHGTSTIGGRVKATVRTTVRTDEANVCTTHFR